MKVKEIKRTANVAWSPKQQHPIYLAAGTAAQQLDATFSTSAALEIYHVDLASKDLEMPVVASMSSTHRFHKLVWSNSGIDSDTHPNGIICGGTDSGEILILDAHAILSGEHDEAILYTLKDHTGPVQALDLNKHQVNLLASGAGDSDIFIWDINKPVCGLTPGPKTSPPDQINCLQWNHQVQHILASSSQTGRVVIWDLRKSEAIIKVGDQSAMFHYKSIAWHPDVATQMLIGNEDDRYPVIQMWDLRFATSPMKVFEGHTRGILSLAWCPQDTDLLMSCGKDNKILCWNPNTQLPNGEIIYELPTTAQWSSDVSWCPRNPGLISTTAFDGHITISTLMGGSQQILQQQNNQISDSFGISQVSYSVPSTPSQVIIEPLKRPPRWMRTPCGARFGFSGKLVTFGNFKEPGTPKQVYISQIVTDPDFLHKSRELEKALLDGQFLEFCDMKVNFESDPKEQLVWRFLKCNFLTEPRLEFLKLLGYDCAELSEKISGLAGGLQSSTKNSLFGVNAVELAMKIEEKLKTGELACRQDVGSGSLSPFSGSKTPIGDDGTALFDAIAQGSMSHENLEEDEIIQDKVEPFSISTKDDIDGLICQALLTGNYEAAVDVCFSDERYADGLLLAIASGPDLFARTQKLYLSKVRSSVSKVISAVVNRDWKSIVENVEIDNWKESLSLLVTYSKAEEFADLCCILGGRLEQESHDYTAAMLCYICAGDVEKMVSCWTKSSSANNQTPDKLQNLIEKVMILKKSVEHGQYDIIQGPHMSAQICNYATLLSSQGNLETAMVYLSTVNEENVNILKDRIFQAHGNLQMVAPECPFQRIDIRSQKQYGRQTQSKTTTPIYNSNQFSPGPSSHQQTYFSASTASPFTNMYQSPPVHSKAQQISAMHSTYSSIPNQPKHQNGYGAVPNQTTSTQLNPSIYNPINSTNTFNQPVMQPQTPQLNMYQPSPNTTGLAPMLVPKSNFGPQSDFAPPPPSTGHPMSLKAAKDSTPSPTQPSQTYNLYNPANNVSSQPQPYFPGNPSGMMQPTTGMPPSNIGTVSPQINAGIVPPRNISGQTQHPYQQQVEENLPAPKEVIQGPIPVEHMVLQKTFDGVLEKCRNSSNNPQTKRKIDDVRKKLEILYDLLRVNKVSQNVLNGLHQMAQACQQMDYMLGIQIHTHMITTGNFSEISSFMPGLKALMQIAAQLKV